MTSTPVPPNPPQTANTAAKRLLVVDDHPVFRLGLVALLKAQDGIDDVVQAGSVAAGLAAWRTHGVDLVTVDLSLPDGDGFALIAAARAEGLSGAVVVVSMHEDHAYAVRAKAAGAAAYVAKAAGAPALADCVRRCLAGAAAFQAVTSAPQAVATPLSRATVDGIRALSPAEKRVLQLLARNVTSREIAGALGVSVRTVENHRANICRKLSLRGPHRLLELALSAAPVLDDDAR
jgi:DNA-binding NarL/FixJ family response regulator